MHLIQLTALFYSYNAFRLILHKNESKDCNSLFHFEYQMTIVPWIEFHSDLGFGPYANVTQNIQLGQPTGLWCQILFNQKCHWISFFMFILGVQRAHVAVAHQPHRNRSRKRNQRRRRNRRKVNRDHPMPRIRRPSRPAKRLLKVESQAHSRWELPLALITNRYCTYQHMHYPIDFMLIIFNLTPFVSLSPSITLTQIYIIFSNHAYILFVETRTLLKSAHPHAWIYIIFAIFYTPHPVIH